MQSLRPWTLSSWKWLSCVRGDGSTCGTDGQWVGVLFRALAPPPGAHAQSGAPSRRDLGGGAVVPEEGRCAHGAFAGHLGRLRVVGSVGAGQEARLGGRRLIGAACSR
jgi:hypothetical protein